MQTKGDLTCGFDKGTAVPRTMNRGFSAIGLYYPKTPSNVGSVLRAASCYGVKLVAIEGERYRGAPTDVTQAWRHLPLMQGVMLREVIPHDCVPVAVDLVTGAQSLIEYAHPQRAFYIFGPEDSTLDKSVLEWCRDRVMVPTASCMNLAGCVNVVLYDRMAKEARKLRRDITSVQSETQREGLNA